MVFGSLLFVKFVLIGGLAAWLGVASLNGARNVPGGTAGIGVLMSMRRFDEAPAIQTPLLSRRVMSAAWHKAIFLFVLTVEIAAAALLWAATAALFGALLGAVGATTAVAVANAAVAGLLVFLFVLLLGGTWFAYHARQETSQLTHFALIGVATAAAVVVNLPSG